MRTAHLLVTMALVTTAVAVPPHLPFVVPIAWRAQFTGPGTSGSIPESADYAGAAVDASGNVYVAASVTHFLASDPNPHLHMGVAKYSPAGALMWTKLVDDDAAYEKANAKGIAATSDGNIVVVGDISDPSPKRALIASLDLNGGRNWTKVVNPASEPFVAAGPAGSVIVGMSGEDDGHWKINRYSSSGGADYTATYGSSVPAGAAPTAIAVDAGGVAFLVGATTSFMLVKLNANGVKQWDVPVTAFPYGLVPDGAGGVVTAALSGSTPVIDYDSQGAVHWTGGTSGYLGERIAAGPGGTFVAIGYGDAGLVVWSMQADGTPIWTTKWRCPGAFPLPPTGLAVDAAGGVHVTTTYVLEPEHPVHQIDYLLDLDAGGALVQTGTVGYSPIDPLHPPQLLLEPDGGRVFVTQSTLQLPKHVVVHDAVVAKFAAAGALPGGVAKLPKKLSFGTVPIAGGRVRKPVTLKNKSKTTRLLVQFDTSPLGFVGGGGAYIVEPKGKLQVWFAFEPTGTVPQSGPVAITTSDPKHASAQLTLSGVGK